MTQPTDRRYIRATISFTECDAIGVPLPNAPVVTRGDYIAIGAIEVAYAKFPELVWTARAFHAAQYVLTKSNVEQSAAAFGEMMAAGHINASRKDGGA